MLRRWWWLPSLALLLAIVWGPALVGPFQFDDTNVIVDYSAVHSLAAWRDAQPGIRPLLKLSYALNWTLSPAPSGFHLVNLVLHALNALLLCAWLRRVLPAARQALVPLAVLLWSLHPVTTEAVTYISGRSMSLSATFMLAALLALAGDGRRAPLWAALCTALALGVRETAWALPFVLLLVEWLRGRDLRTALARVGPSLAVLAAGVLLALLDASHRHMLDIALSARDAGSQLWTQVEAYRWFAQQLLLLQAPNIDPEIPVRSGATLMLVVQLIALLAIALAALWRVIVARSWRAGGVLWFFLLLVPTNSLVPRLDVANDRHLYLALFGPLLALLFLLAPPVQRLSARLPAWLARALPVGVATGVVLVFAALTLVRNLDYIDEVSLWQRTVQQSPGNSRAWNNLGMGCQRAGDAACARRAYEWALALDPGNTRAAVNLYFLDQNRRGSDGSPRPTNL